MKALLAEAEMFPTRPHRPVRRYVAVVQAACAAAGLELSGIQERDPQFPHDGEPRRSVAFLASDDRRYRAVVLGDRTALLDDEGEEVLRFATL